MLALICNFSPISHHTWAKLGSSLFPFCHLWLPTCSFVYPISVSWNKIHHVCMEKSFLLQVESCHFFHVQHTFFRDQHPNFLTPLQLFTVCGEIGQHEMSTLGTGGCGTQDRLVDPSRKVPVKQVAPNTNGIHPWGNHPRGSTLMRISVHFPFRAQPLEASNLTAFLSMAVPPPFSELPHSLPVPHFLLYFLGRVNCVSCKQRFWSPVSKTESISLSAFHSILNRRAFLLCTVFLCVVTFASLYSSYLCRLLTCSDEDVMWVCQRRKPHLSHFCTWSPSSALWSSLWKE